MKIEKLNEVLCTECAETKLENEFYKRFIETESHEIKNTSCVFVKYQGICKECLIKEYQASLENFKGDVKEAIKYICSKYDLPYDIKLIKNNTSKTGELKNYIRTISSLKQYEYKGFAEHYHDPENKTESMSDIDFLERDIENIKIKMSDALKRGDVNRYGKWMNSLRDALELKSKLEKENKWELKYSNYKTDNDVSMISVWEQNNNGEVRNTKQFRLYDEKLLKMIVGLLNQIDISNLADEQGHAFKNNKYYSDLINYLQLGNIKNISFTNTNGCIIIDNDNADICENNVINFNKICIDENDTIIIKVKEKISNKVCNEINDAIKTRFPDNKILIMPSYVDLNFIENK